MLKQKINYEGFDGPVTTEEYFNLTRIELIEIQGRHGGKEIEARINEIQKNEDLTALYALLKDIILSAYGKREGDRFVKNKEVRDEFGQSLAFGQLIEDLHENETSMLTFVKGILSSIKGLDELVNKQALEQG